MKHKQVIFGLFVIVALIQLFVPLKMILKYEDVLQNGKVFKFRTVPIDPNDPFRGKYISLNFDDAISTYQSNKEWNGHEKVFVILNEDRDGFAKIKDISVDKPINTNNYVKADIYLAYGLKNQNQIRINYPFNKFYMEETKAQPAEKIYMESVGESHKKPAYALVAINKGRGVIKDVIIDGRSVKDITVNNQKMSK